MSGNNSKKKGEEHQSHLFDTKKKNIILSVPQSLS